MLPFWRFRRITRGVLWAEVVLGAVLLAPCLAFSLDEHTVIITDKDRTVTMAEGDVLLVKLPARLGTGYSWRVAKIDKCQLRRDREPWVEDDKSQPGGKQVQVFRFVPKDLGTSMLELHYVRPFEKDVPPHKTYRVKVQ